MELYGSIHSISGSMTASVFTGSFKGDGSGLTNIPAGSVSGLNLSQIATGSVSASLSLTGFNVNTNTSITGSLTVSGPIISATSTLISGSSQVVLTSVNGYTTFSSSLATTNATQDGRLTSLETSTSSLNTFTSSVSGRLTSIETSTASLNTFSSSTNTFINNVNGGLEFTGSNVTVKGNFLVKGTTTSINSTTLDIGDNIISLNGSGAANGGLVVRDVTSPNTISGSLLWDTTNDRWIAGPLGSEQIIVLNNTFTGYTSTTNTRLTSIETSTGSLNTFTGSINTTIKTRLSAEGVISGSSQVTNIANSQLTNSSFHVGTTSISLGRTSASQTLTGVSIDGNAATATTAINLSGLGTIQSTSTGTSYTANYQVRENSGGSGNTNEIYAPQLGFHWGGVVASSIMMESSGRITIRNNPGDAYENFAANAIYANNGITSAGSILPSANNTYNLGSPSLGWANIYTNDLHLSNMNKPEGNDIDGTNGTWTIQEGAENLYIINNNNGKKFKISLEEI